MAVSITATWPFLDRGCTPWQSKADGLTTSTTDIGESATVHYGVCMTPWEIYSYFSVPIRRSGVAIRDSVNPTSRATGSMQHQRN